MSSFKGKNLQMDIKGMSHDDHIEGLMLGLKKGFCVDKEKLYKFMERRSPGKKLTSQRKEKDEIIFTRGIDGNILTGEPLSIYIKNEDRRSNDYENILNIPRPGHSDYVSSVKYGKIFPGGGPFSGRLTAINCAFGGIILQILEEKGIYISSKIISIGNIKRKGFDPVNSTREDLISEDINDEMKKIIKEAKENKDSLGGIIQGIALGVPSGKGMNLEGEISRAMFSIPGIKGIEFGSGFYGSTFYGSQNNDELHIENGKIKMLSNNSGGIQGGISNGMEIIFNLAVKPTSSIGKKQRSVNLNTMEETELIVHGRHDPAFILRVGPVVESMLGFVILDELMGE